MRVPIDFIAVAERRAWIETDGKTYWIESDRGERLGPDGWEGNPASPYYRPYSFTSKDEAVSAILYDVSLESRQVKSLRSMLESARRELEELNWLRMQFDPDFAVTAVDAETLVG